MPSEIPESTLREIYAREAKQRGWPEYAEGMQNEIIRRIVEIYARHVPAYKRRDSPRWEGPVKLDIKRLASGEKPEDYE